MPIKDLIFVKGSGTKTTWGPPTCVAVAFDNGEIVVKNSNDPLGVTVRFTQAEWEVFLKAVKDGEFEYNVLEAAQTVEA